MQRLARALLLCCLSTTTCFVVIGDDEVPSCGREVESAQHLDRVDAVALLQGRAASLYGSRKIDKVGQLGQPLQRHNAERGFRSAFVISIEVENFEEANDRMQAQGVQTELSRGYNGSDPEELREALQLLKRYGMTEKLHPTVNNWLACMHTSPGKGPNIKAALSELAHSAMRSSPTTVDELLEHDSHKCVPKVVAIAAAHVKLWEDIAQGRMKSIAGEEGDPWYLIMEDDAALCPGWRQRLAEELPQAPADADVLKLFFFGHWRAEDQVKAPDGSDTPFLQVHDPLKSRDLITAALYEVMEGAHWKDVPIAGFYAGTQAYLLRREGARKLLKAIRGAPFQDIDMTMMLSVKHYVWRKVLTSSRMSPCNKSLSLLQTVPMCNHEPSKDWFGWS